MSTKKYTKPPAAEIKGKLTPEQFEVTQACGTEPPFHNAYWDNHKPGIYVDVVTGEPLFSSTDKFDSGTGWPSFTRPVEPDRVAREVGQQPRHARGPRSARRAATRTSGHVFDDGPGADAPALLHQLGVAALHPGREAGGRGLRRVPRAVPAARGGAGEARGPEGPARGEAGARDGDPGGRLLLGHGGAAAQDPGRARDGGRLHGRQDRASDLRATCTTGRPATPRRCASCSTRAS